MHDQVKQKSTSKDRKIGNNGIIILALSFNASFLSFGQTEIKLAVLSAQGVSLDSVKTGTPFSLVVTLTNISKLNDELTIPGLDKIRIMGRAYQSTRTTTHGSPQQHIQITYSAVANTPGVYTFGPVTSSQFPSLKSNTHTLHVLKGKEIAQSSYEEPHYDFIMKKTSAYVGEKIPFIARISWQHPDLKLFEFETPEVENISVKQEGDSRQLTEQKGTSTFQVLEFPGYLSAAQPGTIRIPKLEATYSLPARTRDWSSFLSLSPYQRHSVFSSEIMLTILPLPPTKKEVLGVGNFTEFTAMLSKTEVPQGEAVNLTLVLKGESDFSLIKPLTLILPASFRQYISHSSPFKDGKGGSWEYIIQALDEGIFTIPSQEAYVFDVETKGYKTLRTQPLQLNITKGSLSVPVIPKLPLGLKKDDVVESKPFSRMPFMPLWLFLILILMPPFLFFLKKMFLFLWPYYVRCMNSYTASRALDDAQKQIKKLQDKNDIASLYEVIQRTLKVHFKCEQVRDDELAEHIKRTSLDDATKNDLIELLAETVVHSPYASTKKVSDNAHNARLFERTLHLLRTLKTTAKVLFICVLYSSHLLASDYFITVIEHLGILPYLAWQISFLVSWWILWFFANKLSKDVKYFLILCICIALTGVVLRFDKEGKQTALILQTVPVYSGPATSYPVRTEFNPGEEVVLVKDAGQWYHVSSKNINGWVESGFLKKNE